MAKLVQIEKVKADVYLLVEGLTSNIGRKNPDIDFETLWASEGDERSLDIYYREAIGDLEEHLQKWLVTSSEKPDVTDYADDEYTINLSLSDVWPERLRNLLEAKVQDYLAHATLAGWLSGFADLKVGSYEEIATADLEGIMTIITRTESSKDGKSRHGDGNVINDDGDEAEGERGTDADVINDDGDEAEGERGTDADVINDDGDEAEGERCADADVINDGDDEAEGERCTDEDAVNDDGQDGSGGKRCKDDVQFEMPHEHLDLSGTINHFCNFRR